MSFTCTECKELQDYKGPEEHCYVCACWLRRIANRFNPDFVVIDHHFYIVAVPETTLPAASSQVFTYPGIQFYDGRKVKDVGLYDHGLIPERFRERFPNNAEFVQ